MFPMFYFIRYVKHWGAWGWLSVRKRNSRAFPLEVIRGKSFDCQFDVSFRGRPSPTTEGGQSSCYPSGHFQLSTTLTRRSPRPCPPRLSYLLLSTCSSQKKRKLTVFPNPPIIKTRKSALLRIYHHIAKPSTPLPLRYCDSSQ